MKFWIWRLPLLWATISVMEPEVRLISKKKVITFPASVKLFPNDQNLYLSSAACNQSFKHLFDNDPLQYCRNSLVISESSRGPYAARGFDTSDVDRSDRPKVSLDKVSTKKISWVIIIL